jgi:hypothetical protein
VLLILVVAVQLRWLPASGYASIFLDPAASLKLMILTATAIGCSMAVAPGQGPARGPGDRGARRPAVAAAQGDVLAARRLGAVVIALIVLIAIAAPWLAPYDPTQIDYLAIAGTARSAPKR